MAVSLLLDLEGTLLDSREATVYGLQAAWRELHPTEPPSAPAIHARMAHGPLYETPELRELASRREVEWIAAHPLRLFPGVPELLQTAHERGHRVALVTLCSRPYTEALIASTNLKRWLHCWFCEEDSTSKADLVKMALRELGRPAVLLGDRPSDLEAATAHRVPAYGAGWSYAGADLSKAHAVLRHPLDLLDVIE